ncbi:MAG TPA: UbiA family prenyltransferase [Sphingomonas sp.]|jgi:4-hydroxybenzoate polyprenyltransferase|uniref:UbiA family prenyltransferase n=1 Tax=Sphingomonas sp. TaxID=28214 RepID=UPI002EDB7ADD
MYQGRITIDTAEARRLRDYVRAMRPHQWSKDLLIFVPVITSHRVTGSVLADSFLGFVAFCLAASAAYVLNDLLDLRADRLHPRKRLRPFASGMIPIWHGIMMAAVLAIAAVGAGMRLSPSSWPF